MVRLKDIPSARGLYFLHEDDRVVYVGQANNILNRVRQHSRHKRFNKVTWQLNDMDPLDELEKSYIREYQPKYNRIHNPRRHELELLETMAKQDQQKREIEAIRQQAVQEYRMSPEFINFLLAEQRAEAAESMALFYKKQSKFYEKQSDKWFREVLKLQEENIGLKHQVKTESPPKTTGFQGVILLESGPVYLA